MLIAERWKKIKVVHESLVVWGASDQLRVNYQILKSQGCNVEALIDDTVDMLSPYEHIPIFRGEQGLDSFLKTTDYKNIGFVVAIGNPYGSIRLKLHILMKNKGLMPTSFADETSLICKTASYGEGLQVMPLAIIHNDVEIGNQCIINTKALIEHDCILNDGVEVGPGAVLCGRVNVGKNSWIGANATINPRVTIGSNTIIGAGAVVVNDIPSNVIAFGVPAKVKGKNRFNYE